MATFVVTLSEDSSVELQGRARHVSSGEEIVFASAAELLDFIEMMNAAGVPAHGIEDETGGGQESTSAADVSS